MSCRPSLRAAQSGHLSETLYAAGQTLPRAQVHVLSAVEHYLEAHDLKYIGHTESDVGRYAKERKSS